VRGLLLQDKSVVDKPYTATSCTDSLVIRTNGENNGKSTGVYRTFSQNRGLLGAATPQLSQTKQGDTACAFHMSPTALEISESNLATFFRKLRRAPMRDWSELV